jgi:hypothetical protein
MEDPITRLKTLVPFFRVIEKQKRARLEDTTDFAEIVRITDCIKAILKHHGDAISAHRKAWTNKKSVIMKALKEFDECLGVLQMSTEKSIEDMLKVVNTDCEHTEVRDDIADTLIKIKEHATGKLERYRTPDHRWEYNVLWNTLTYLEGGDDKFGTRRLNRLDFEKKVKTVQKKAGREIPEDVYKFFWSLTPLPDLGETL